MVTSTGCPAKNVDGVAEAIVTGGWDRALEDAELEEADAAAAVLVCVEELLGVDVEQPAKHNDATKASFRSLLMVLYAIPRD